MSGMFHESWSKEQKKEYLEELRLNELCLSSIRDSGSADVKPNERRSAIQALMDLKQSIFDLENSINEVGEEERRIIRLERMVRSLTVENKLYKEKYGEMFGSYEDVPGYEISTEPEEEG